MQNLGHLREVDGRIEFHYEAMGLVVRGNYVEWVLEAAAEIIAQTEKLQSEGKLEELETLMEFGEASDLELETTKHDVKERFEIIPQCVVSMGSLDYKWTSAPGRDMHPDQYNGHPMRRIQDMSLTRNDTFLKNVDGVDTTGN